MPGRPEGSAVTLTYDINEADIPEPDVDDLLVTINERTGELRTFYLVLTIRQVRSTVHPRRFSLRCLKVGHAAAAQTMTNETRVYPLYWYPRKRQRKV